MAQKKDAIDKLVDNPKRILFIVIIIVIIVLLIYFFWGKIKTWFSGIGTSMQQNEDLNNYIATTGVSVSLSDSEIKQLCNKLYNAFYGGLFGWGTDEDAVYEVFNRINNQADLYKLIAVYGTRENMTLDQAIVSELNNSELKKLNTILANKGINYQF